MNVSFYFHFFLLTQVADLETLGQGGEEMGGLCRPLQASMVWLAVLLLLLGETVNTAQEFDPYRVVLGLTKSAGQAEVKKVYKRLVREW